MENFVQEEDDYLSDNSEEEVEETNFNDEVAMKIILEEMKCKLDWIQHLDITVNIDELSIPGYEENKGDKKSKNDDIQDDFKRELSFYCQAQVAAKEGLAKLRNLNIQTERPEDYFAEMVKSDAHMQKIRQKLLERKQNMEKSEKAKKQRQLKKVGKKIQQEVLQKRQEEKKKMLQAVDKIKKGKNKLDRLETDEDIFNVSTNDKTRPQERNMKRKRKDDKFGFGGKKRKLKKNSAESSSEMTSFKSNIHGKSKSLNPQKFGNKNKKSKGRRLGKSRLAKTSTRKK